MFVVFHQRINKKLQQFIKIICFYFRFIRRTHAGGLLESIPGEIGGDAHDVRISQRIVPHHFVMVNKMLSLIAGSSADTISSFLQAGLNKRWFYTESQ